MTDLEKLVKTFDEIGVEYTLKSNAVIIYGDEGKVKGYTGFYCYFEFDNNKNLEAVGVFE